MKQISENEKNVIKSAGKRGGMYLETIGQSDVTKLSEKQWESFIFEILYEILFDDSVPF